MTTVATRPHVRNLECDRGGCPHEVDVPGFEAAPFLHFTYFLPTQQLVKGNFKTSVVPFPSQEPSLSLSVNPPVQQDTQVKLSI